jgi:hypothetical protein
MYLSAHFSEASVQRWSPIPDHTFQMFTEFLFITSFIHQQDNFSFTLLGRGFSLQFRVIEMLGPTEEVLLVKQGPSTTCNCTIEVTIISQVSIIPPQAF